MDYYDRQAEDRYEAQRAEWVAEAAAQVAEQATMYESTPLPGVQPLNYAGGRYYANEEDARRARLELAAAAQREYAAAQQVPSIDALAIARAIARQLTRRSTFARRVG